MARDLEIENGSLKIFFLSLFFLTLASCSLGEDCFVSDVVDKVTSIDTNGKSYFLYLRTSGFNEREHFYELYDHIPEFDVCGVSPSSPVSEVHVDSTAGNVKKLIINSNLLKLVYSKDALELVDLRKVSIELR